MTQAIDQPWIRRALTELRGGKIGVAFSGGKESLVILDMLRRLAPGDERIPALHASWWIQSYTMNTLLADAIATYQVRFWIYPHPHLAIALRSPLAPEGLGEIPAYGMRDAVRTFLADSGCTAIALGHRRDDPLRPACQETTQVRYPLRDWTRAQVIEYLVARMIPLPPDLGRADMGVYGLNTDCLRWLEVDNRQDLATLLRWFPCGAEHMYETTSIERPDYSTEVLEEIRAVVEKMRELSDGQSVVRRLPRRGSRTRVIRGRDQVDAIEDNDGCC